jgi:hypothetical protein
MKIQLALVALLLCASLHASEIKDDEYIRFYPSTASVQADGTIKLRIQAWIYENEQRPGAQWLLSKYLKIDESTLSEEESERYTQRTQLFRLDSERNKRIRLQFSQQNFDLPKTNSDGRVDTALNVASKNIGLRKTNTTQWLHYRSLLSNEDSRQFLGRTLFVPSQGISIVSDIDDTIKDSNVLNKKELLLNTFVREFKTVDGMAERYRQWNQQHASMAFHYVSGSPHQLFPALDKFFNIKQFPDGSLHLRDVSLSKEVFGSHGGTRTHKLATIRQLINDFRSVNSS